MTRTIVAALSVAALSVTAAKGTTFSDTEFNNGDWSSSVAVDTASGGTSSAFGLQIASGGNPDAYRETTLSFPFGASGNESLLATELSSVSLYEPAVSGAIESLALSTSYNLLSQIGGTPGLTIRFVVVQDGELFETAGIQTVGSSGSWVEYSLTELDESDFSSVSGSGMLDLSAAGSQLQFGYGLGVGAGVGNASNIISRFGVDNWSLEVAAVPEPHALALAALLFCGLGLHRRR